MDNKGQAGFATVAIVTVIGLMFLVVGTLVIGSAITTANYTAGSVSDIIADNIVPFMLLGGLALAGALAFVAFRGR